MNRVSLVIPELLGRNGIKDNNINVNFVSKQYKKVVYWKFVE